MSIVIDPDVHPQALRNRLYAGDLVILTHLRTVDEFVEYTRGELAELFSPHDPEHVHEYVDPVEIAGIATCGGSPCVERPRARTGRCGPGPVQTENSSSDSRANWAATPRAFAAL